jgi:hypothetical protein
MDVVVIAIMSVPAIIAAISSLRNGKILKHNNVPPIGAGVAPSRSPDHDRKAPAPEKDWFQPPNL